MKKYTICYTLYAIFVLLFHISVYAEEAPTLHTGSTRKINLLVITPTAKECPVCNTKQIEGLLKNKFPELTVSYLYYPDKEAIKLIEDFGISGLPAYLLGEEVEEEKIFENLKQHTEKKGRYYILNSYFAGLSYFLHREKIEGRLDLFISLFDKRTFGLLDTVKEFNPNIHFLVTEQNGHFSALYGLFEVEEYLRSVCVRKLYPDKFWNYINCRAKDIYSSWWDECSKNLDLDKIRACANGDEGASLLREDISLNKELGVMFGPTYLIDNYMIFSSKATPSKQELEKIIRGK